VAPLNSALNGDNLCGQVTMTIGYAEIFVPLMALAARWPVNMGSKLRLSNEGPQTWVNGSPALNSIIDHHAEQLAIIHVVPFRGVSCCQARLLSSSLGYLHFFMSSFLPGSSRSAVLLLPSHLSLPVK
jgi:hypothetical protein